MRWPQIAIVAIGESFAPLRHDTAVEHEQYALVAMLGQPIEVLPASRTSRGTRQRPVPLRCDALDDRRKCRSRKSLRTKGATDTACATPL